MAVGRKKSDIPAAKLYQMERSAFGNIIIISVAWTVYDEMVYYEADYIDYLTDHEGKGAIEPTSEHYTKVMSYDIQSGDTKILYQAEDIIEITDLCTDGKILIWEEYPRR